MFKSYKFKSIVVGIFTGFLAVNWAVGPNKTAEITPQPDHSLFASIEKITPQCGNGILEFGEQCDEGGNNGVGMCSISCTAN